MSAHAVEKYLRTIQALDDEGVEVIQARIAERMAKKASSVSQMVDRLTTYGYLLPPVDASTSLTGDERSPPG